ncbi:fibropellin-3-like [Asterias rubens]|uniref:fibropellin-3-like n=1 Tax=Asterias rubens TaxID=7604 RepID=UPI001455AC11|nr:fibropellin-3-like [Asterias rubens]
MEMKVVLLLLGLAVCVSAVDAKRRSPRDLSVEWLWAKDGTAPEQENEVTEKELLRNRTPKATCSIHGIWYNQLGSEVIINATTQTGVLIGEFRTGVESKEGAAGVSSSKLVGHTSISAEHDTFGMTVMWQNGRSVTSWTGQCHICNGEETLMTTWIMTSKVETCEENWKANRIGQDIFKRYEVRDGPRRQEDTHTPRDVTRQNEQDEEQKDV